VWTEQATLWGGGLKQHCMAAGDALAWRMPVAAVLFDFDGVLVDTEWTIYQAWADCFRDHGQELPLSHYTRCIGSDFATWSPKDYLHELIGRELEWQELDRLRQQRIMTELAAEGPMPGVMEMLAAAQGLPRVVVSSSTPQWVGDWLHRLELRQHFDDMVCRGDAPRIKPAPDLFLEAARRLDVNPQQCLVIEDSLNGVRAAQAAGMQVWAVPNRVTAGLVFHGVDALLPSLQHGAERLNSLRDGADKSL